MKRKYNISKRKYDGMFSVYQWMLDPQLNELRKRLKLENKKIPDYLKHHVWVCIDVFTSRFKAVKFVEGKENANI